MNKYFLLIIFVLYSSTAAAKEQTLTDAFSPRQGATKLVVSVIDDAHESVHVAAYSFTSRSIADALVAASQRGVEVMVVLDKRQGKRSMAGYLRDNGIPVRINSHYAIMHNKFIIIDDKVLELGSFNYTKSAEEKNAENVLVIRGQKKVIKDYSAQWSKLWDECDDKSGEE